jgi:hypothetical protein
MGIRFDVETAAAIGRIDGLLMDVARRLQVPPSKHQEAVNHYKGLCRHVDRQGSPLENKVRENYPSGSFAIHAAIYSKVKSAAHDVDVVVELDISEHSDPSAVLDTLYRAIKGEPGSEYYDLVVERNSRCVTVTYRDGVTVDLMPVVRIPSGPERSAWLFHHKQETNAKMLKEVNPKAFSDFFNANVGTSETFASQFGSRRLLVEGDVAEKAETQPMPDHLPLDEKSPTLVALQLLKRFRDVQYRPASRKHLRKPPSIVIATLALESAAAGDSLVEEVMRIARFFIARIRAAESLGQKVVVVNPAHPADVFTDRWPEERSSQQLWQADLERLVAKLQKIQINLFDPEVAKRELTALFGETLAKHAIEEHFRGQNELAKTGRLGLTKTGSVAPVLTAPAIASSLLVPARANTNMGGTIEDPDDR